MPMYGGGAMRTATTKSSGLLIIGLLCCFCIIIPLIIYGSLWGTNTICDKTNPDDQPWLGMNCASVYESSGTPSPTTSTTPAPATLTAKQTLLATGQAIQVAEKTISVATPPTITTQPTGITATGSFTLSIDINVSASVPDWVCVLGQGPHPRHPGVWINNAGVPGGIRFHMGAAAADYTSVFTFGEYFNMTAVYNATTGTLTLYKNGVANGSTTVASGQYNPSTPTNFEWNQQKVTAPTIKVKNTYWFNKALTAAEVTTLAGTSTYMPQPLTMGTSAYTKEMYKPY